MEIQTECAISLHYTVMKTTPKMSMIKVAVAVLMALIYFAQKLQYSVSDKESQDYTHWRMVIPRYFVDSVQVLILHSWVIHKSIA